MVNSFFGLFMLCVTIAVCIYFVIALIWGTGLL